MTTPNNDELRKRVRRVLTSWRSHDFQVESPYYPLDDIMQLIATHDQQLLEAILEGIVDVYDTRGDTQNGDNPKYWTRRTKAINERNAEIRQHIKSVFGKEGE